MNEYDSQHLTNILWSCATMGFRNRKIFDSIAWQALKKINEYSHVDCSITAWAFATMGVLNPQLMEALAQHALSIIDLFDPQNLSNLAWAFATFGIKHDTLMAAIAPAALNKISDFSPQELANIAWAYDVLGVEFGTLKEAVSKEVLRHLPEMETQALTFLVDVGLSCADALRAKLQVEVLRFLSAMPQRIEDWEEERIKDAVRRLKVDSFGATGSRLVWDELGISKAPSDFEARALQHISELGLTSTGAQPASEAGSERKHKRVFAYAEYSLEAPVEGEEPIEGKMLFENGFRCMRGDARWLRHVKLPINSWVDRSLCAECQMMTEFCTELARDNLAGTPELNALLKGTLYVFTSSPQCISCLGVLRQFQLLFPAVTMFISHGTGRGMEAWLK